LNDDERQGLRREIQAMREETSAIGNTTEALRRLLPDFRGGMDGETGEALLAMRWPSAIEARAFFVLARDFCAGEGDLATAARFDAALKRLEADG
jgi:hypothetical protein